MDHQTGTRVSDTALSVLPKTEDNHRKQYLTVPLIREIQERLAEIIENKRFFGSKYYDYRLLIC